MCAGRIKRNYRIDFSVYSICISCNSRNRTISNNTHFCYKKNNQITTEHHPEHPQADASRWCFSLQLWWRSSAPFSFLAPANSCIRCAAHSRSAQQARWRLRAILRRLHPRYSCPGTFFRLIQNTDKSPRPLFYKGLRVVVFL